jgi:hypothetical protein
MITNLVRVNRSGFVNMSKRRASQDASHTNTKKSAEAKTADWTSKSPEGHPRCPWSPNGKKCGAFVAPGDVQCPSCENALIPSTDPANKSTNPKLTVMLKLKVNEPNRASPAIAQDADDGREDGDMEVEIVSSDESDEDGDILADVLDREDRDEEKAKKAKESPRYSVSRKGYVHAAKKSWVHLYFKTTEADKNRLECRLSDYTCSSGLHPRTIALEKKGTTNALNHFKTWHLDIFNAMEKGKADGEDATHTYKTVMASLKLATRQLDLGYFNEFILCNSLLTFSHMFTSKNKVTTSGVFQFSGKQRIAIALVLWATYSHVPLNCFTNSHWDDFKFEAKVQIDSYVIVIILLKLNVIH